MIQVCNAALKSADPSLLSEPHFVSPLLGLTLDSGDFRRASLQLSALGDLPPPLPDHRHANYDHLQELLSFIIITIKLYNSI